jgi:CubicO group peptidase (beta-lactamase class C family)
MSVLISKTSGMSTCELAFQFLFDPLDIAPEYWQRDPQGYFTGAAGMMFTPRELATFGLLYLHRGEWNGTQIVPAEWINESLTAHMYVERTSKINPDADWWLDPVVTGYDAEFDYGYYWWITTIEGHAVYSAIGWGGQRIHVIPDLDMVVVTTSNMQSTDQIIDSFGLLEKTIIPAVISER